MSFSNIDSLNLGMVLQVLFTQGIRLQISKDFRDFEMIKRARVGTSTPREIRFMVQNSLGMAAIQYRSPGVSNRAFPAAQQATVKEYAAKFKEINATIELEYNLWERAQKSPEKYAEPLAIEMDSKSSATKRKLANDIYQDGTGVVGQLAASSVTVESPASDCVWVQLDTADTARGGVGSFEFNDILVLKAADGDTSALDTNLTTEPAYWMVIDKDRKNDKVLLQGLDATLNSAGTISSVSEHPTAGDVFYRYGQPTIPDLTSISDYGTATEVLTGLESLAAADGRTVNGMTMRGATAGTVEDCGGSGIDVSFIESGMNKVKLKSGEDRFRWKQMVMAPETHSSFVESREVDRRFNTIEDNKRGLRYFAYQHRNDTLECVTSEFAGKKRIWILPESKAGEKVLEFHGTDFKTVKGQGMGDFHLKPASGGGHVNTMVSYLQSVGVLISRQPGAILSIRNFVA